MVQIKRDIMSNDMNSCTSRRVRVNYAYIIKRYLRTKCDKDEICIIYDIYIIN